MMTGRPAAALVALATLATSAVLVLTAGAETQEVRTYRAYPGAPPAIPHQVRELKRTNCLGCHEKGGDTGSGIAPKTPHPQRTSCEQCHVVQRTHQRFVESTFEPLGSGTEPVKIEAPSPGR